MRRQSGAKATGTCAAAIAALVLGDAQATEPPRSNVIVQVVDHLRLSRADASAVESLVSGVYTDIGVRPLGSVHRREEEALNALDEDAFNALFSQHQGVAFAYAYSILKNGADAEDATQAAFLMAWLRRVDLRGTNASDAGLQELVRTECCRIMRHASFATEPLDGRRSTSDASIAYLADRSASELLDAIQTLSRADRAVIRQRYMTGLAYRELCQSLHAPLTTVKKRLHDARRRLRVRMTLVVSETSPRQKRRG